MFAELPCDCSVETGHASGSAEPLQEARCALSAVICWQFIYPFFFSHTQSAPCDGTQLCETLALF